MKNVSEKWQLLNNNLKKQHRDTHIKTIRNFLTTTHLVDKYLDIMESTEKPTALNRTEKLILYLILAKRDYMTPTEISKITIRTVDTINKSVDGLNKKGLIRSSQSKTDRRLRKVILTEKGLEWAEINLPVRELCLRQAMNCFSNDEVKIFDSLLKRLREQVIHVLRNNEDKSRKIVASNTMNDPFDNLSNNMK